MSAWLHIVPAALMLLFMTWKEMRRKNRRLLIIRLLASFLAVLSLVVLSFPGDTTAKQMERSAKKMILLTEGYAIDSVKNELRKNDAAVAIYATDQLIIPAGLRFPVNLWTAQDSTECKNAQAIRIFGNGLTADQLSLLTDAPVLFNFPAAKPGIVSINWTKKLNTGDRLRVQGSFQNPVAAPVRVYLRAFDTIMDSITIAANSEQDFQLGAVPGYIGRATFSLVAMAGKDTIENEELPVEVCTSPPLRILVLASSPNFENKFLKNWLAEKGYGFTIRTTISRNKYAWQYLNMAKSDRISMNSSFFDPFNVVIADADELMQTGKPELESLRRQIEQKGMGMIVRADSPVKSNSFYMQPFSFERPKTRTGQSFILEDADTSGSRFTLHAENSFSLRRQPDTRALLSDDHADLFAGSAMFGSGKIIMTTLTNTYSLVLAGNQRSYSHFWSALLQESARRRPASASWKAVPEFIHPDEAATILLETTANGLVQPKINNEMISLKQNLFLPFQWEGRYWPEHAGWQEMVLPSTDTAWSYVYQPGSWKNVLTKEKINRTREYARQHPGTDIFSPNQAHGRGWLMVFVFLVFLCSCGFLWVEKKMGG